MVHVPYLDRQKIEMGRFPIEILLFSFIYLVCMMFILSIFVWSALLQSKMSAALFSMPQKQKVLCCGIATLDTIATLDEYPSPDTKVRSNTLHHYGGGNAANTAVAMSRLGRVNVDLISAIGNDANGDTIMKELVEENVGVDEVQRYDGDSPWSYIVVAKDTRTIIHHPATKELSVSEDMVNLEQYCAVHFDGRHPEAAIYLSKKCIELGIPYSVDVERPREGLLELLSGATVVFCTSNYCAVASGSSDISGDDEKLLPSFRKVLEEQAPNAKIGIMTMGGSGSFLIQKGVKYGSKNEEVVAQSRDDIYPQVYERYNGLWCEVVSDCEVEDTTGAGDVFQGGVLSALCDSGNYGKGDTKDPCNTVILARVLRIGSMVASRKIQLAGRAGLPSVEDQVLTKEFEQMRV